MALQGSYTDPFGDPHTAAYFRINDVRPLIGLAGLEGVRIGVSVWKDATLRNAGGQTYENFEVPVSGADLDTYFKAATRDATLSPLNAVLTAAYNFLKAKDPRCVSLSNA